MLAHDPGTRLGTDLEELHQMRVATRRLRAFLRAGNELVDPEWSSRVRDELKWLGGVLGPVRDLDVLTEHLASEIETLGDDRAGGRKLLRTLERNRRTARRRLLAALGSERYFALLDTLEQPVVTVAERRRWRRSRPASTNGSGRPSSRSTRPLPTRISMRRGSR